MKRSLLLCISFIVFLNASLLDNAEAGKPSGQITIPQEILILNSYHPGYAFSDDEQAGLIDAFRARDKKGVPVIEYLDMKRLPDGKHLAKLKQLFRFKYQNKKFSVVIAMDNPALEFAIDNQADFLGNAPIVFCGINNYTPSLLKGRTDVTGIMEAIDPAGTIEVMLRLHPATKEIFIPHDYTVSGLTVPKELGALVPRFKPKVRFRFADPLTMEELLKELERLPKNSLVLAITFVTDKSGRTFSISESTKLFAEHSPVPIYATHEQRLGFGIVGGKLLSGRMQGTDAARIVLRVLTGEKASTIPVVSESDSRFMFDYKVMSRFGIPLSALPKGSTVINEPVSFYATHRVVILTALGIIVLLAIIISLLIINIIQRKRSSEVIRRSEELFKIITSSSPDHLLVQDIDLRYSFVMNPQLGLTQQDMIGKTDHDFLAKDDADRLTEIKRQVLIDRLPVHMEVPLRSSQGDQQYFEGSYIPKFDAKGQAEGLIGYFRNVTKRKQVEQELRESEQRYHDLFEQANEGLLMMTPEGELAEVNRVFAEMHGYTLDEIKRKDIRELDVLKERTLEDRAGIVHRIQVGEVIRFEVEHYHKDGHIFPLAVTASMIQLGGQMYYLAFHQDITERKRTEAQTRELLLTLESVPNGILVHDADGNFLYANQKICDMHGYSWAEFIALNLSQITESASAKLINVRIQEMSAHGELSFEVDHIKKDGTILPLWINVKAATWDGKSVSLSVETDITERRLVEEEKRSLEERLQRSEKMEALGQLAGGVAHDLNNVLGILSGYSELLLDEIPEGSRSRGHVEKILQSTEKGAAIIQDLLTLARRGITASDVINLDSVVSDFIKSPVFEKIKDYHPRVTFRTECYKNLLNIKGSPVHLDKALMNLISNAAEAITGEGSVTIRTESRYLDKTVLGYDEVKEGDYVVLTVSDTGMGIPAEDKEKIFEPFYSKKKMGRSGTGLGLAIVWGTVKDHNGYIDIQTEVGKGSTFVLYFPVAREELPVMQNKEPMEQYMGNGESVLVVDDIAEQREIASRLLTRLGYEVHSVSGGEEAVEYLTGNKADILVIDMVMIPGIDGLETYQRILKINPKQKAIIVSGFSETDRVKEAQKLGAGAYVKKPYVLERIGVAIRDELAIK